jgi:hypothetical protein
MGSSKKRKGSSEIQSLGLSKQELDDLVDEAITDANGDEEALTGFYTMIENDLRLPFETEILGVKVSVESIDLTEDETDIVAVCRKGKLQQRISVRELPLPSPPPEGAQWIVAYRHFRRC